MAYTGIDKEIYDTGVHFRPLQKYTQQQWTPPEIMGQNTGITATQAAGSYMGYPSYEAWLLAQGGGDGGGGGQDDIITNTYNVNQNLGPTNITDYEAEADDVGPTWAGSWARAKDAYSKLPLPSNLLRRGIMKWRENREIKKEQERIAEDRTGIGEHDRGTFEGDVHPDAPTKIPEPGGWHPGVGGADSGSAQGTDTPSGHAGGWGPGAAKGGRIGYDSGGFGSYKDFIESTGDEELMELYSVGLESGDFTRLFDVLKKKGYPAEHAKGGRIGYATRGFVDENINVEGPGFDENIEMASAEGVPFMWEEFLAAKAVDPDLTYNDFLDSIDRSPSDFFGAQGGIAGLL